MSVCSIPLLSVAFTFFTSTLDFEIASICCLSFFVALTLCTLPFKNSCCLLNTFLISSFDGPLSSPGLEKLGLDSNKSSIEFFLMNVW